MARILAIDFGLKRVGLAVTDPLQIIASGLTTIEQAKALEFITDYCIKETVECIVIGYPLNMDGSETNATNPVEKFIKKLSRQLPGIPVIKEDERFTSKMAKEAMLQGGVKKMKRRDKSLVDMVSATLILQAYLENR